jgi:hypothetical protein
MDTISNPAEYAACGSPVLSLGLPYRFTEANSCYTGGGAGVSGGIIPSPPRCFLWISSIRKCFTVLDQSCNL